MVFAKVILNNLHDIYSWWGLVVGRLDNLLHHMWTRYSHQISNIMSRAILWRAVLQRKWDRDRNLSKYYFLIQINERMLLSYQFQLKDCGQAGVHGVHAQRHAILVWELEQEATQVASHVLEAHLKLEIVSVSLWPSAFYVQNTVNSIVATISSSA